MSFYAVARGRNVGIYNSWNNCKTEVTGFSGAIYKKFNTKNEALNFIKINNVNVDVIKEKFKNDDEKEDSFSSSEEFAVNLKIDKENDSCIICFTDGSCPGNGNNPDKAAYSVIFPFHKEWNKTRLLSNSIQVTNNRAELMGVIKAIKICNKKSLKNIDLIIYTDSKLTIDIATNYMKTWKNNSWKRKTGPIANLDLVQKLDSLMSTRKISIFHVKAHSKGQDFWSIWNREADKLCFALASS